MEGFHSNKFSSFLISTILSTLLWTGEATLYKAIHWDPLNPMFKTTNRSALQFNVTMKSQMNIICPNVATNLIDSDNAVQKDSLYENLWFVDRDGFESCQVNTTKKSNLLLYKCDDPINLKYRTLTFKAISPIKGEPEYEKGMEYYFLATSNGSKVSLDNKGSGHCKTHNMRFKIYICTGKNDQRCKTEGSVEPKTTSSTPTNVLNDPDNLEEGRIEKSAKCFLTSRDKIWFIVIGVVIGVLLMLLVGWLAFTCITRRRSSYDDQLEDGKIPLSEKVGNNRA